MTNMKLSKPTRLLLALILALGLFAPVAASAVAHRPITAQVQIAAVNWNH